MFFRDAIGSSVVLKCLLTKSVMGRRCTHMSSYIMSSLQGFRLAFGSSLPPSLLQYFEEDFVLEDLMYAVL